MILRVFVLLWRFGMIVFRFITSNDFTSFCTALAIWYDLFSALLLQMILRVTYCSGYLAFVIGLFAVNFIIILKGIG
jgi:hypothetical protein